LARGLVLVRPAAIDQHVAEGDALALEHLHHQVVRAVETGLRVLLGAEAVLVGHHDELPARVAQADQCRDHAAHEAKLLVGVDLQVCRLLDQGTIAVDEEDRRHATATCASAARTRAFWSGVPMVMRSASPRAGAARWSRTTTPASSSRSKA